MREVRFPMRKLRGEWQVFETIFELAKMAGFAPGQPIEYGFDQGWLYVRDGRGVAGA